MSDFDCNSCFERQNRRLNPFGVKLAPNKDLMMEQILENLNNTPIGQVLQKIASLPEVRKDKIINVRRQLTDGKYDLNERLDIAMDKVLEDLTAQ